LVKEKNLEENERREFIDCLEEMDLEDDREKEADEFARKHLKMDDILRYFQGVKRVSRKRVTDCANYLGLRPGIVVGCLQHEDRIGYNSLNEFKEPIRPLF